MIDILNEINFGKVIKQVREKIKKGPVDTMSMQKPFSYGMYAFSMFMIAYYSRVRDQLKIDYDSFMIVQTTVTHQLYHIKKKDNSSSSFKELETIWDKVVKKNYGVLEDASEEFPNELTPKLSISSICLVTGLPKETVRRKVNQLTKKNILKITKKGGVVLGTFYKKIFREFVPQTVSDVSKLVKNWERIGILKNLLSFK